MIPPRSGDVLHVGPEASVQFGEPILFRVIRLHDWITYDGWLWLDGYQLDAKFEAVDRRSIFVQRVGLQRVNVLPPRPRGRGRTMPQRHG
jgi:hypothetical protein